MMHTALSGPSFVPKLQTNVKIKKKNQVFCHIFLVFLDKFFKFKNENGNYNHIFTWIFFGGAGAPPPGGSGLSIFLHNVIHPIKLSTIKLSRACASRKHNILMV
jgi:hypothetical protein